MLRVDAACGQQDREGKAAQLQLRLFPLPLRADGAHTQSFRSPFSLSLTICLRDYCTSVRKDLPDFLK